MAPLFSRRATFRFRTVLVLLLLLGIGGSALLLVWSRSDAAWRVGVPARQPIPFRHSLHAGTLAIDCRFCHATAERAADAGMPSAGTCLACHSQVLAGASLLEPLRTAAALDVPIVWSSVSRLPAHAQFHHGAHVARGIGCATCHGAVEAMPETVKAETLSMGFCLDCHRDPARSGRNAAAPVSLPLGQAPLPPGHPPVAAGAPNPLADCSACHR